MWLLTLLSAAIFCFITFFAGGGLPPVQQATTMEIILTLGCGAIIAAAVILTPRGRRAYGLWPVGLLLAFAALSALSVVWSVQPDASWQNAGLMFAYSAVFGAAVALARAAPARWPAVIGGVTLAAVVVCGYALLTKVFPASLDAHDIYARLQAPYGYWNATGLTAAMGVIGCLWLGARRAGHALLSALAYPATGLLLVTVMLAYSRGALVALALGLALWFCVVPLRLRGAAVLLAGAAAAALVVAWDFSKHALSAESVALHVRVVAGRQLGVLLVAMLVLLALAGIAIGFSTSRRPLSRAARANAGAILLSVLVLAVIAFTGALAASHRGLTGSISHGFHSLTNTHAAVPANTPGRLTAIGSVRARYWNEALKVFQAHPALGAGARSYGTARLRYRTEDLEANDAHGFVVQTLADLGLVGLAIVLALLATWMAAAGRATHPFNRRWTGWRELKRTGWQGFGWRAIANTPASVHAQPTDGQAMDPRPVDPQPPEARRNYSPERIGMLSMLCLVVVFGVHSTIDWTWFVPGDACVALLCAGWLAGRGPLLLAMAGGDLAADGVLPAEDELFSAAALAAPAGSDGARLPSEPRLPSEAHELPGAEGEPSQSHVPTLSEVGPLRLGIATAVVIAALLAAWAQWQPQRSANASQEALALSARDPAAARAAAQNAVDYDPVSAEALFTLSTIQEHAGQSALARATLVRAVHLQPSNPQTWKALGEYDLRTGNPKAALNELRATVYLNPEAVAPLASIRYDPELLAIQNAYIQALRETMASSASVKHVTVVRTPTGVKAIVRSPAGVKSVTVVRSPAALAARRAALRRAALRRLGSRSPRAAR
jgi:tetratricopeptide (TPR) repeat protein